MFITFEGIDCSGKSTQATLLAKRLEQSGHRVVLLREPGGTTISEQVRSILLDNKHKEMDRITEFLLFSASRAQLVKEVILPALHEDKTVVCDRFYDSSTAYQGWGRGINIEDVKRINHFATLGTVPDITFLIDIPPSESLRRKRLMSGSTVDRMEGSGLAFYEQVRNGYLAIAESEPERFFLIDGMKSVEEIAQEIWRIAKDRLTDGRSATM
jgi:dTMP kinase